MDGIIIINKPKGYTSHDIVNKVRKIYNTKKVGHTGTLDPNATGVLPILIGKATKLSNYLTEHNKQYIATLKLGEKRDTGDLEGKIIETEEVPTLNKENIELILKSFLGKQEQTPPMYSAIKINGKKLYEYARDGKEIEVPKREIEIYDIKLNSINESEIKFLVDCSKGTYIRSLCEDIAKKIGTVGFMKELIRTKVDEFEIENSYTLEELEENKENVKVISIEELFENNEKIVLDEEKLTLFLNGGRIKIPIKHSVENDAFVTPPIKSIVKIYNSQNQFIGTGIVSNNILKRDIII